MLRPRTRMMRQPSQTRSLFWALWSEDGIDDLEVRRIGAGLAHGVDVLSRPVALRSGVRGRPASVRRRSGQLACRRGRPASPGFEKSEWVLTLDAELEGAISGSNRRSATCPSTQRPANAGCHPPHDRRRGARERCPNCPYALFQQDFSRSRGGHGPGGPVCPVGKFEDPDRISRMLINYATKDL